jgi:WD40 repeat protein
MLAKSNFFLVGLLILSHSFFVSAQRLKPEAIVQTGHRDVAVLEISPNGKLLASVGLDEQNIYLWDVASAKLVRILEGHKADVTDVSFSADSKSLATCSKDRAAKIWDLASGAITVVFEIGDEEGVAFSPDGKLLAASDATGKSINLWDIGKQAIIKNLGGTGGSVFSPDGKTLFNRDEENVYAWDVKSGQKLFSFEARNTSISVSPDGEKIAVNDTDVITVRDAKTGQELTEIAPDRSKIAVFTADGKGLIATSRYRELREWEVSSKTTNKVYLDETKGVVRQFDQPKNYVNVGAVTPDGKNFISGHQSDGIKVWNIESGKIIKEFAEESGNSYKVSISPDGQNIFFNIPGVITGEPTYFWNTVFNRLVKNPTQDQAFEEPILFFSPNKETLLLQSEEDESDPNNKSGLVVNAQTGEEIGKFPDSVVSYAPNGKTFLTNPRNLGKFSLRDARNGELIRRFDGSEQFTHYRAKFAFSKDSKTLGAVQIGEYSSLYLWETETGKLISKVNLDDSWSKEANGSAVALNLDSKLFATNVESLIEGFGAAGKSTYPIILANLNSPKEMRKIFTGLGNIDSMRFTPDGKTLILQDDFHGIIEFLNVATGQLTGKISDTLKKPIISFSENGKRMILSGGEIRNDSSRHNNTEAKVYDIPTGELLLTVASFKDGNWIGYTPEGYYQASDDEVFSRMSWRVGTKIYDFERFFERYFKADLIRQIFGTAKDEVRKNSITKGFALPPEVRIVLPDNAQNTTAETIALTIQATDQGGGVRDIRLYQNGKRLSEKQRGISQPKETSVTFNVSLLAGKNVFRATAYSSDQTEAEPSEITIERKAQTGKSDLYILAVGINAYKNTKYNLNYAGADAQALSEAIEKKGQGIFGKVYKTLLTDSSATKEGIAQAFKEIADRAKPQDSFIFFYAGHGILIENNVSDADKIFYLVPHDVTQITDVSNELTSKGISAELLREWTTRINAGKQLIMLDACQSGGAIKAFTERGLAEEKAILQLARSAGIVILAATGTEQQAIEFKRLGHGVFTYALLQGLSGEADGNPSDRVITVSEIEGFLDRKVPELTKEYRGTTQYPQRYSRGQDFPLGIN